MLTMLTVTTPSDAASPTGFSLREAVAQANLDSRAGISDTITFLASLNGGTITLTPTLGQLELGAGGSGSGLITINGANEITISGGNASRVFQVDSGVQADLIGVTITQGSAQKGSAQNGGAIVNNGTLTLSNSTLAKNNATNAGGGIENFGTLIAGSTTFSNNSCAYGGGIFNDAGTVTLSGCSFSTNSGYAAGGGICNGYAGTVTVSSSSFSGNTSSSTSGGGGAIYNGGSGASLTVNNNSTFTGNSAGNAGGAIDNYYAAPLTVTSSTFGANTSEYGGGIYSDAGTATISGCNFSTNSGYTAGGGLFNGAAGTATVSGSNFSGNTSSSTSGGGGAIYNGGSGTSLTVNNNSTFTGNSAGNAGGAIENYYAAPLTVTSSTFGANTSEYGGGIYTDAGTATISGCNFSTNSGYTAGGGLFNGAAGTVTVGGGSTFSGNYSGSASGDGGAIYNGGSGASLTVSNSALTGNWASNAGGAIDNYYAGPLTVTSSTFGANTSAYGGGIYNAAATLAVSSCTFSGNSVFPNGYGGGIFNGYAGVLTVNNNSTFSANSGSQGGGGIYNGGGCQATVNNATFFGNSANAGFAIDNTSTLTLSGSSLYANTNAKIPNDVVSGIPRTPNGWANYCTTPGAIPGATYVPLFGSGGPLFTDVEQGEDGDCWLMASLAEVALRDPSAIRSMFTDNYDGTVTVRFYNSNNAPVYITVTTQLPAQLPNTNGNSTTNPILDYAQPSGCLWVALAEKAYAEANSAGLVTTSEEGSDSYQALNFGDPIWALQAITGQSVKDISINPTNIAAAWSAGQLIVLDTDEPLNGTIHTPNSSFIVGAHDYALVNYAPSSASPFELYNPWGADPNEGSDSNGDLWAPGYTDVIYGLFWASATTLSQNFSEYQEVAAGVAPAFGGLGGASSQAPSVSSGTTSAVVASTAKPNSASTAASMTVSSMPVSRSLKNQSTDEAVLDFDLADLYV